MRVRKVVGDYRLTSSSNGLRIEVLDYHAEPLLLTTDELRRPGRNRIPARDDDAD